jgi:hypothetical protein
MSTQIQSLPYKSAKDSCRGLRVFDKGYLGSGSAPNEIGTVTEEKSSIDLHAEMSVRTSTPAEIFARVETDFARGCMEVACYHCITKSKQNAEPT